MGKKACVEIGHARVEMRDLKILACRHVLRLVEHKGRLHVGGLKHAHVEKRL